MRAIQAIKALFRRREKISEEQMAAAVRASMEWNHRNRLPEKPGVSMEYMRFIGAYMREHSATLEEANEACRAAHPEYWPRTVPQPSYSDKK